MPGHPRPPYSVPLINGYYFRPEINPVRLPELLKSAEDGPKLLLDVKGVDGDAYAKRFAATLTSAIQENDAAGRVEICGQLWPVLTRLRADAPELHLRFSIEREDQWSAFVSMSADDARAHDVCVQHRFLSDEKLRFLKDRQSSVYAWTVDRPEVADRLTERGVDGIISNNLSLLSSLAATVKRRSDAQP
jgi:glycerophosphoryl diester phosphodiesterase